MCSPLMHQSPPEPYISYDETVRFHGHTCVGLASGYRVAVAAMKALGVTRPRDEELVAIAETDACGVDAVQMVTGCTAGKGNLIIHDYGKHAFSFYCRRSNQAVRVVTCLDEFLPRGEMDTLRPKVFAGQASEAEVERFHELAHLASDAILHAPEEKVVKVTFIDMEPPKKARIFTSIPCECCGEMVADVKTREKNGKQVCIPCFLSAERIS